MKKTKTKRAAGSGVDHASEVDRTWFEMHPNASEYVRPYITGEFWPVVSDTPGRGMRAPALVRVTQIRPGFRIREPLHDPHMEGIVQ